MKKKLLFILVSAVPFYGYSLPTNRDSAAFYLNKALSLAVLKKAFDADKNFKKAIEFDVENTSLKMSYARFLLDEKKYFPAFVQLQKVLEASTVNLDALQKIIDVSFYLHRWKDVISYTGQAMKTGAQTNKYRLGKAYFEDEDYGLSEKALLLAIQENPHDLQAQILLAKVYVEISDYKRAVINYQLALALDPNNPDLLYEVGLLYSTINNEKDAIRYIELAAANGYKIDLDYKENLGMAYLSIDLEKGIELLNEVLAKKPDDPEILLQIADANYRSKNFKKAADIFYFVYQKDQTNSKALYMTGKAYQKNGDKAYGMTLCDKAIQQDPSLASLKVMRYAN